MGILSNKLKVFNYSKVKKLISQSPLNDKMVSCVFVGWYNSHQKGNNGIIFHNQKIYDFKQSLINAKI